MPPTFKEQSFIFEDAEQIPEHIEAWPYGVEQDPDKYWLMGTDMFSCEDYVLAVNIDDLIVASFLAKARLRELEKTQPTATSGGKGFGSIQDTVRVMYPGQPIRLR